ncbi:hypothetical protein [Tunturiibacter gelidoferens]|uniref:Uncharacterized protein n=1 Tax=Tunturiibacter lichenicola TaxID=2051959 RepID=A0A7Y9NMY1_9BACT|nr:hypothetical protein [Edaphobacter lichenicola]NYF52359.1 hypothetical protein [Edaphobacter lichenicola]
MKSVHCYLRVVLIALIAVGYSTMAIGQTLAYAFDEHCFNPPTIGPNGISMVAKLQLPSDCHKIGGVADVPFVSVYTQTAVDAQLKTLNTKVDDLTKKAIEAIEKSVANDSVKAGEIDALVQSIESRLYARVLARVKADLANPVPSPPSKATP